jgi:hypothetical protein
MIMPLDFILTHLNPAQLGLRCGLSSQGWLDVCMHLSSAARHFLQNVAFECVPLLLRSLGYVSRTEIEEFYGFPQVLEASTDILALNRPRWISATCFPVHWSQSVPLGAVWPEKPLNQPVHPRRFDYVNNIPWRIKVTEIIISCMRFPAAVC